MTAREPWFLRYERDEIRRSGDLGPPMNPLADISSGPPGLLDRLPDRLRGETPPKRRQPADTSPQEVNTHG